MEARRYKTAFIISKIGEIAGWAVIVIGVISGLSTIDRLGVGVAFTIVALSAVSGILLVFMAQLTLIFIDTENNTRQAMSEILRTNAMLGDTLGSMAANLNRIAGKGDVKP